MRDNCQFCDTSFSAALKGCEIYFGTNCHLLHSFQPIIITLTVHFQAERLCQEPKWEHLNRNYSNINVEIRWQNHFYEILLTKYLKPTKNLCYPPQSKTTQCHKLTTAKDMKRVSTGSGSWNLRLFKTLLSQI